MDEQKINAIYNSIREGEDIQQRFEGNLVQNFDDLMKMEKDKRNNKIEGLLNKMDIFEEIEEENAEYFEDEYGEMDENIQELYNMLQDNQDRLSEVLIEEEEET